ncbi:hypothetical protein FRC12_015808 [Ceratobasidium sp. 428]|nr:hypothetical protein FRC12_015808 [Ceratobasidium sp. 428]
MLDEGFFEVLSGAPGAIELILELLTAILLLVEAFEPAFTLGAAGLWPVGPAEPSALNAESAGWTRAFFAGVDLGASSGPGLRFLVLGSEVS